VRLALCFGTYERYTRFYKLFEVFLKHPMQVPIAIIAEKVNKIVLFVALAVRF